MDALKQDSQFHAPASSPPADPRDTCKQPLPARDGFSHTQEPVQRSRRSRPPSPGRELALVITPQLSSAGHTCPLHASASSVSTKYQDAGQRTPAHAHHPWKPPEAPAAQVCKVDGVGLLPIPPLSQVPPAS